MLRFSDDDQVINESSFRPEESANERSPLLPDSISPSSLPYSLHHNTNGEVVICIQDAQGVHREGTVNLINTPRESLSGLKRLALTGYLEKVITQYGAYPLKTYIKLIKDFIYHKEKGVAHTVKSALHLPLVMSSTALGVLLPIILIPELGVNLQNSILSMAPFLSSNLAYGIGVFTSTLVCSSWGAKLSDSILSFAFKHILDSPDPILYFTQKELEGCLTDEELQTNQQAIENLHYAIEYLQGEYTKSEMKFQDFEQSGDAQRIQRVAEKLRENNFKPLVQYATLKRDKEMVSLSFDNRNQAPGKDAARELEMYISDKVIKSFSYKQNST